MTHPVVLSSSISLGVAFFKSPKSIGVTDTKREGYFARESLIASFLLEEEVLRSAGVEGFTAVRTREAFDSVSGIPLLKADILWAFPIKVKVIE